jgi:hypothetical protein
LHPVAPNCTKLHQIAPNCTKLHGDARPCPPEAPSEGGSDLRMLSLIALAQVIILQPRSCPFVPIRIQGEAYLGPQPSTSHSQLFKYISSHQDTLILYLQPNLPFAIFASTIQADEQYKE